ncbi:ABC transporter substrate-binding protein [Luedemannella flava]|uniref:ABC transporter substrate-binding protein n=1 Tax=Luedemannella flava TaxID=349316 RepID=A0ABN2LXF7_9ACTN
MSEKYSRRDFLTGVLISGTLSTAALSLFPGSRSPVHVELRLLSGVDPTGARQLLVDMWNRANPNTTVHLIGSEGATGDQRKQMETDARKGVVDIVNLDTIHIRAFVDQNLIVPVEVDDTEVFLAPTIRANRVDGAADRLWAVPFNTDVGMLFERTPAGARPGTPKLAQVIDRLPAGGLQFVGQLAPSSSASHEAFVINILEHALSRDPKIIDADGTPVYDLATWQQAVEPLHRALRDGRVAATSSEDETLARFTTDPRPRYMRNWPVAYRNLQKNLDEDARAGRIEVSKLPIGVLGGQSLAVVAGSPHHGRATEVIHFLTGEQAQKVIAAHGLAPTRLSAYNDSNLRAFVPHLTAVRGAVEEARPRPAHRNYAAFAQAVSDHLRRLLSDDTPLPSRFIDEMRDALA